MESSDDVHTEKLLFARTLNLFYLTVTFSDHQPLNRSIRDLDCEKFADKTTNEQRFLGAVPFA